MILEYLLCDFLCAIDHIKWLVVAAMVYVIYNKLSQN
jgi:hypothetical protein